jgi:hypothetical protein
MTNQLARLYSLVVAVLVFFVAWAAIAAHPWQAKSATAEDPSLAALQLREQRLRAESLAVKRVVDKRWATYRAQLALRKRQIASINAQNAKARAAASLASAAAPAAPSVRVVTLPPLTITRTS